MDIATLKMIYPSASDAKIDRIIKFHKLLSPVLDYIDAMPVPSEDFRANFKAQVSNLGQNVVAGGIMQTPD